MAVLRNCFKLKGSQLSISEDFSAPVRALRSKLWRSLKAEWERGDKVTLAFDKLKINDQLYVWNEAENSRVLLDRPSYKGAGGSNSRRT